MQKNTFYLLVIVSLLLAIGIISCQDQKIEEKDLFQNFNDLITETDGKSYQGEITSFVTDSNEVVVKLAGDINKLYILQKSKTPKKINIDRAQGQITYLKNALIINTLNPNNTYFLGVDNDKGDKLRDRIQAKVKLSNTLSGYGLVEMNIDDFDKYNFSENRSIYYSLSTAIGKANINTLMSGCRSGGPGSTSCSYSDDGDGCSVSCSDGYYSCCNPGGCGCRSNQIDPG